MQQDRWFTGIRSLWLREARRRSPNSCLFRSLIERSPLPPPCQKIQEEEAAAASAEAAGGHELFAGGHELLQQRSYEEEGEEERLICYPKRQVLLTVARGASAAIPIVN